MTLPPDLQRDLEMVREDLDWYRAHHGDLLAVKPGRLRGRKSYAALSRIEAALENGLPRTTLEMAERAEAAEERAAQLEAALREAQHIGNEDYILRSTHDAIAGREHRRAEAAEERAARLEAAIRNHIDPARGARHGR